LLHFLDERFFIELRERGDALLEPSAWEGASVADVLMALSHAAVEVYTSKRGIARSLFLRARVDPLLQANARQVNGHFIRGLQRLLLLDSRRRAEIAHPDAERAIALGFIMFFGALRETTVFGEVWPDYQEIVGTDLESEMARLYLSYLGAPAPVSPGRPEQLPSLTPVLPVTVNLIPAD
jgi:hypothetical protein